MSDLDEKYLDPNQNSMILTPEAELKKEETGGGDADALDGIMPTIDLTADAASISEKLAAAFPGVLEISMGTRTLVLMADGKTFTEKGTGRRLEDFALADLMAVNEFLEDRQKKSE